MALLAELAWRSAYTARRLRSLPPGLYVFNLHRIGRRELTPFDPNVFSCTPEALDAHIRAIRQHFDLIDADRLDDALAQRSNSRQALLTFDDGYRDNFTEALPVLRSQRVRPLFFICTGFVDGSELPWWDAVAWLVRHSEKDVVVVNDRRIPLRGRPIDAAIREVLREFKLVPGKAASKLEALAAELALKPPGEVEPLFMTWDELRDAKRQGVVIGSHSVSHDKFSHLSPEEQERELADSKAVLDRRLEQDTVHLAYPVGGFDSFTESTKRLAVSSGYRYAFTTEQHSNPWQTVDRLSIGRFSLSTDKPALALHQMLRNVLAEA